jgi:hypothetical protein
MKQLVCAYLLLLHKNNFILSTKQWISSINVFYFSDHSKFIQDESDLAEIMFGLKEDLPIDGIQSSV